MAQLATRNKRRATSDAQQARIELLCEVITACPTTRWFAHLFFAELEKINAKTDVNRLNLVLSLIVYVLKHSCLCMLLSDMYVICMIVMKIESQCLQSDKTQSNVRVTARSFTQLM